MSYYQVKQSSPTMRWYEHESNKKSQGLCNEIDTARIKCATKGMINEWTPFVLFNQKLFDDFLQKPRDHWDTVLALLQTKNSVSSDPQNQPQGNDHHEPMGEPAY